MHEGSIAPTGEVGLVVSRDGRSHVVDPFVGWPPEPKPWHQVRLADYRPDFMPRRHLPDEVNEYRVRNLRNIWRGARRIAAARVFGCPTFFGALYAEVRRGDQVLDYGCISLRVVTDTGVAYIVDAFGGTTELENMRYHGFGTGSNAEAVGNTALHTELTTEYASDNTRPTGTLAENAANIFETVGILDPDSAVAITEHGIFSQAATGGGVLLDKSLFSAINLAASGDTLTTTYRFTITSGS
jgi:hypothetical protein